MVAFDFRRQQFSRTRHSACALASAGAIAAMLASACTSSSVALSGPSGSKCQVNVTSSMQSAPPSGASGTLTIATSRDCTWAVSSGASWIVITSGSTGQGDGAAAYRIAANTEATARRGTIDVNSTQVTIAQDAACRFDVEALTTTVPAAGGSLTVAVQSGGSCGWTAVSQADWISIASGSNGTGNGAVTLNVGANGGGARTGNVLVAGRTIAIAQAQAPAAPPPVPSCDVSLAPTSQSVPASGGTGDVSVAVADGCAWAATKSADWITIVGAANGSGHGQVHFSVAANPAASARQGTLTIGGRTATIAQAGVACTYSIQPTNQTVAAAGGTGSIALTTSTGCSWTATSNAPWIAITSASSGSGSASVTITVAANTGSARSGTVTVGGQMFTVDQAASCTYGVAPTTANIPDSGGGGTIAVGTDASCAWTATSNASWIAITSGASGTGNGNVAFTVTANTGAARMGTLTVAGQTVTVNQSAPPAPSCSFSIAPPSASMPDAGGSGSVTVAATGSSCAWTAAANAPWLAVTSGATGSGNGTVAFSASANIDAARSGTITIAGQPFMVNQAAAACTYTIAPTTQTVDAVGGGVSITVTTGGWCAWSAASNANWLTITAGAAGTGNGAVSVTAAANSTGSPRTGTVTVAGQSVTFNQNP